MAEARINFSKNILITLSKISDERLVKDFCGSVKAIESLGRVCLAGKTVYLCGDLSNVESIVEALKDAKRVLVIEEYCESETYQHHWPVVGIGQVPFLIHGVGVYYRQFFDRKRDYFSAVTSEHVFQNLTESTKPGKAHRRGLYLTAIQQQADELHFRLLRCSTNLSGPTDNFRSVDWHIVGAINREANYIFENHAPLNHVLAQIYDNDPQRQTKAKIKPHADKTKDMPSDGIMAFCTFYNQEQLNKLTSMSDDPFDYGYKRSSGLTRLDFRLKASVEQRGSLPERFSVTLYPGSVFFMPLSTNRLYTHEIRPSVLDAAMLPTRLGYVVRCSSTEAVYKNEATFLKYDGELVALQPATVDGMQDLKKLYAEENKTEAEIEYGHKFRFSMNKGDYCAPSYKMEDEFRVYNMQLSDSFFNELKQAVAFEDVAKGRKGAVIVQRNEARGVPIVRTTTKYNTVAQYFQDVHEQLARQILETASLSVRFNNALVENYRNDYFKMGFHSDQALDLADASFIAIFSCYKYPEAQDSQRILVVESKQKNGSFEIPLTHNSIVVFSLDTNQRFRHKIVLDKSKEPSENEWLGVTFRTSKTFVQYRDGQTYFEDGTPMMLASQEMQREFYLLRGSENRETKFVYPRCTYTLSQSDLMKP